MPTRPVPLARSTRCVLLAGLVMIGLAGCETPEVIEPTPEPVPEPEREAVVIEPVAPPPPSGALLVRLHAASDAAMPDGAVATVTLERGAARHATEMQKGERLVEFAALEPGRYDLTVTVRSRGVEIGTFGYFVEVGASLGDVTVQIDYVRADLVVEATVETASERRYIGTANMLADTCPGGAVDGSPSPTDLVLATDGSGIELTLAGVGQETTRLSGRLAPVGGEAVGAGTFESSAGNAGAWRLEHLSAPAPGALAAVLALDDHTRTCEARIEYVGLLEDGHAQAAPGLPAGMPTIEVVGHGDSRSVTLDEGASEARFEGLLVGPYDVFVGLHHGGEGALDTQRESVVLTAAGARVATTFEREWAPVEGKPLAVRADYGALGGTYRGKSVITNGPPACTGSIPLVDTTELILDANGRALALTLDSFYGRVLELGGAGEATGATFAASGTYTSADGKAGTWTIPHLAAPTPRSLAMLVEFRNETDACRATYGFVGVR